MKAEFFPRLIGHIACFITRIIVKTISVKVVCHENVKITSQFVYCFWHNKQFAPVMYMGKLGNAKQVGLVSPSKDGEILAAWLKQMKYHVVRGSSSQRSISSLVKIIAMTKQGFSIGIAADGPRGPLYKAKSGAGFIAYKSGLPILPMGAAYSKKFIFDKAWDKFQFPLPFSKIVFYFGDPLFVKAKEEVGVVDEKINQSINLAERKAAEILGK